MTQRPVKLLAAVLVCIAGAAIATAAEPCVDYGAWMHRVGLLGLWEEHLRPMRIVVDGDLLYFNDQNSRGGVIDIADPRRPALLPGVMWTDAWPTLAFDHEDGHVYLGSGGGLTIYDVSDPAALQRVAFLPCPSWVADVVVRGTRAYVSRGADGTFTDPLDIVDVSDPAAPRVVTTLEGLASYRGHVSGNRLYLYLRQGTVCTLDIADPDQPVVLGNWDILAAGYPAYDLTMVGDMAFLPCHPDELLIVDLADPLAPDVLGTWSAAPFECRTVAVSGSLALVGGADGELMPVDISNPAAPFALGNPLPVERTTEIVIRDGLAYIGSDYKQLDIIDISNPRVFADYAWHEKFGPVADVCALPDDDLCLMLVGNELQVVDLGAPGDAAVVAALPLPGEPQRVAVAGTRALVACGEGGLVAFDVADPRAPLALGAVAGVSTVVDVAVGGDGFVALSEGGPLWLIDPTAPQGPAVVGSAAVAIPAYCLAVDGNVAYVGAEQQLQSFAISDPTQPASRWVADSPWAFWNLKLVARDGLIYFMHGNALLVLADNGTGYDLLNTTPYGSLGLGLDGDTGYALSLRGGAIVFDFTDPIHPLEIGSVNCPLRWDGPPACVATCADRVVFGFEQGGFLVTPRHCSASVGVEVTAFTAEPDGHAVRLRWTANAASSAFRVVARSTAGDRLLFGRALGDNRFEARDDAASSPGAVMSYVLEREESPGAWVALATAEYTVSPPVGSPRLVGCVPNPFNPGTRVDFTLPTAAHATVTVHDAAGRQVAVLADRAFAAGPQSLAWDGRDTAGRAAASGVYLVRLRAGAAVDQGKMLLVR